MEKKGYKYAEFGKILRETRKMNYDDIKSFSRALDIQVSLIYDYEMGRVFPPIDKFIKICNVLNKSPVYLLSPYLKLSESEKEILHIFERIDIKEILNDDQIANILKFALLGFEIVYQLKKQMNYEGDVVDFLNNVKGRLFADGQLKKLQIKKET